MFGKKKPQPPPRPAPADIAAAQSRVISANLAERKAKLMHRAPHIINPIQLEGILASFPAEDRADLLERVKPLLRFKA